MHYKYFDSELGLWYNSKAADFKSRNQCLNKCMKGFKFSNNIIAKTGK